ncbi:CarboxypepD_reg-like domain-containing protein [Arachidicoccus rhizosphaerae]|jgi:hypothetical protein|uniref:CarboxypepD_reg-like domain-containing protein n=1 Tax=Arachidicoccus rhizosphaerae TaxID=551991 RepID=A0A1H3WG87_9BACT|nr:carboxypeptidase-like regulatory domain-containing protein [Arachidicoccus rhizosphaerae]SDZ86156.1 CarboxypepD_reg-like domain-containing protein [Arachidicoccus rhizosphaerae]
MKLNIYIFLFLFLAGSLCQKTQAQQQKVIQLSGIVQASDSTTLPGASIFVRGTKRGTIANDAGIYSIAVSPGDSIEFSYIGFKSVIVQVPLQTATNQLYSSPILSEDTAFLPTAIVSPLPTPAQFKYMFINSPIVRTNADIARENLNIKKLLKEMRRMPLDGDAIYNMHSREDFQRGAGRGMVPTSGIFNPLAWRDFIRSLKEGGSSD